MSAVHNSNILKNIWFFVDVVASPSNTEKVFQRKQIQRSSCRLLVFGVWQMDYDPTSKLIFSFMQFVPDLRVNDLSAKTVQQTISVQLPGLSMVFVPLVWDDVLEFVSPNNISNFTSCLARIFWCGMRLLCTHSQWRSEAKCRPRATINCRPFHPSNLTRISNERSCFVLL